MENYALSCKEKVLISWSITSLYQCYTLLIITLCIWMNLHESKQFTNLFQTSSFTPRVSVYLEGLKPRKRIFAASRLQLKPPTFQHVILLKFVRRLECCRCNWKCPLTSCQNASFFKNWKVLLLYSALKPLWSLDSFLFFQYQDLK